MTKGLLPVVSEETLASVKVSVERRESESRAMMDRMMEENPTLAEFVLSVSSLHDSYVEMATIAATVYELLRSQAETDGLSVLT